MTTKDIRFDILRCRQLLKRSFYVLKINPNCSYKIITLWVSEDDKIQWYSTLFSFRFSRTYEIDGDSIIKIETGCHASTYPFKSTKLDKSFISLTYKTNNNQIEQFCLVIKDTKLYTAFNTFAQAIMSRARIKKYNYTVDLVFMKSIWDDICRKYKKHNHTLTAVEIIDVFVLSNFNIHSRTIHTFLTQDPSIILDLITYDDFIQIILKIIHRHDIFTTWKQALIHHYHEKNNESTNNSKDNKENRTINNINNDISIYDDDNYTMKMHLSLSAFIHMWEKSQGEILTLIKLQKRLYQFTNGMIFYTEDLFFTYMTWYYLIISEENDVFDPKKAIVYQDMNKPLTHYYINTSHNTYITTLCNNNNIYQDISIVQIIDALTSGCRCISITCWNGEHGEPIVSHTTPLYDTTTDTYLTKFLLFQDVIDAIKLHSFINNICPLIINMINHCNIIQQNKMVQILCNKLEPYLYLTPNGFEDFLQFPCPEKLKQRILIKSNKGFMNLLLTPLQKDHLYQQHQHAQEEHNQQENDYGNTDMSSSHYKKIHQEKEKERDIRSTCDTEHVEDSMKEKNDIVQVHNDDDENLNIHDNILSNVSDANLTNNTDQSLKKADISIVTETESNPTKIDPVDTSPAVDVTQGGTSTQQQIQIDKSLFSFQKPISPILDMISRLSSNALSALDFHETTDGNMVINNHSPNNSNNNTNNNDNPQSSQENDHMNNNLSSSTVNNQHTPKIKEKKGKIHISRDPLTSIYPVNLDDENLDFDMTISPNNMTETPNSWTQDTIESNTPGVQDSSFIYDATTTTSSTSSGKHILPSYYAHNDDAMSIKHSSSNSSTNGLYTSDLTQPALTPRLSHAMSFDYSKNFMILHGGGSLTPRSRGGSGGNNTYSSSTTHTMITPRTSTRFSLSQHITTHHEESELDDDIQGFGDEVSSEEDLDEMEEEIEVTEYDTNIHPSPQSNHIEVPTTREGTSSIHTAEGIQNCHNDIEGILIDSKTMLRGHELSVILESNRTSNTSITREDLPIVDSNVIRSDKRNDNPPTPTTTTTTTTKLSSLLTIQRHNDHDNQTNININPVATRIPLIQGHEDDIHVVSLLSSSPLKVTSYDYTSFNPSMIQNDDRGSLESIDTDDGMTTQGSPIKYTLFQPIVQSIIDAPSNATDIHTVINNSSSDNMNGIDNNINSNNIQQTSVLMNEEKNHISSETNRIVLSLKKPLQHRQISPLYSELVSITNTKMSTFIRRESLLRPCGTCTIISDKKVKKYLKSKENFKGWLVHNNLHFSFIKPSKLYREMTNYSPGEPWAVGCQFVALNHQLSDIYMHFNHGKFRENGNSGYVLKPAYLCSYPQCNMAPPYSILLTIEVISAYQLPITSITDSNIIDQNKDNSKKIIRKLEPYIVIKTTGAPKDIKSFRTQSITCASDVSDPGYNPVWNETFSFPISNPEVALITFEVMVTEYITTNTSTTTTTTATSTAVTDMTHSHVLDNEYSELDDDYNNITAAAGGTNTTSPSDVLKDKVETCLTFKKKTQLIAFSAMSISCMRNGLRSCILYDKHGQREQEYKYSSLLLKIRKERIK